MKTWKAAILITILIPAHIGVGFGEENDPRYLSNDKIKAEFTDRGLSRITDKTLNQTVTFAKDEFSLTLNGEKTDSETVSAGSVKKEEDSLVYLFEMAPSTVKVVYELKTGWRFVSKQIFVTYPKGSAYRVNNLQVFRSTLRNPISSEYRIYKGRYGAFLRLESADSPESGKPTYGIFLVLQNPFVEWNLDEQDLSLSYSPEMAWRSEYGDYAADRALIGTYKLSGTAFPADMVPEWRYVPDPERAGMDGPMVDVAEIEALTECVRAFLLFHREKTLRIHVGWCENDYQIDVGTPEGVEEYKRIIDRAADLGCNYILYGPENSKVSDRRKNTDAWAWENLLWLGLGQKIRTGEWNPENDPIPESVQEMLNYAKAKGIRLVAYAYPSLGFMQNSEWTAWAGGRVGGYIGADTGVRSFQDWWIKTLVAFQKRTGAGGFSFDHWWIAYGDPASSKYAQWYGARRILESLREKIPEVVIDGRQQYQGFGPWTWLAGSYPHPTAADEQPGSFTAFPDLHFDRVSANRERFTAWWYRMQRFCPVETVPGFITHQTQRVDADGDYRRNRFRPTDWDYLGWRYSLLSSIGAAPLNHVVNMIPARDPNEFKYFSDEDKKWFRDWLDWTDQNIETMRRMRPIIGQPMLGRVDGSSAIIEDKGFVFLFNPNHRRLNAKFNLDGSIGLTKGERFILEELYPRQGRRIARPGAAQWNYGDTFVLEMEGAQAMVLKIDPAPSVIESPILFNAPGRITLRDGRLEVTGVSGEIGTEAELVVLLPEDRIILAATVRDQIVKGMTINGKRADFTLSGDTIRSIVRFGGNRFSQCQQVGSYDPNFTGGTFKGSFDVPARILEQLKERKEKWPIPYTEDDLLAPWLGPDRLLFYVQIAQPNDRMEVSMSLDDQPVELKTAYSSVYPRGPRHTFLGWYTDISSIQPDTNHKVVIDLPDLEPGQFQGLYFENVETQYTQELTPVYTAKE